MSDNQNLETTGEQSSVWSVLVREVVEFWVEVEADSKTEARQRAISGEGIVDETDGRSIRRWTAQVPAKKED